jgi:hypothetical protein
VLGGGGAVYVGPRRRRVRRGAQEAPRHELVPELGLAGEAALRAPLADDSRRGVGEARRRRVNAILPEIFHSTLPRT